MSATGKIRDMLRDYQARLDRGGCRTWAAHLKREGLAAPTSDGDFPGMQCRVCGAVISHNQIGSHFLQKAYRELSQEYRPHQPAVDGYRDILVGEFGEACHAASFTIVGSVRELREAAYTGRKTDSGSVGDAEKVVEVIS